MCTSWYHLPGILQYRQNVSDFPVFAPLSFESRDYRRTLSSRVEQVLFPRDPRGLVRNVGLFCPVLAALAYDMARPDCGSGRRGRKACRLPAGLWCLASLSAGLGAVTSPTECFPRGVLRYPTFVV